MDMHAGQIQGFFNIPFDHLYAAPVLLEDMRRRFDGARRERLVIVSPDAGGVERARAYSKRLGASLAIVDKRRTKPNVAEVMNVIGDVQGKVAVLLDDMIDTAGTLTQAANALVDKGASRGLRLRHPRACSPARRWSASRRARSRRWWSPTRSRSRPAAAGLPQDPRALGGQAARRGGPAHPRGGLALEPLRLAPQAPGPVAIP